MHNQRHLIVFLGCLLTSSAWAQSAPKPLNLTLSAKDVPAARTTPAPAHATSVTETANASRTATAAPSQASRPGVYYGDTSGRMGNTAVSELPDCDDSSYNQPQVHGSVGAGVVGGNHISGNYQSGTVHMSQAFGSCDHPTGGVNISIGVSQGHFHNHRRGH